MWEQGKLLIYYFYFFVESTVISPGTHKTTVEHPATVGSYSSRYQWCSQWFVIILAQPEPLEYAHCSGNMLHDIKKRAIRMEALRFVFNRKPND